jgi:DHA1 family tetracycline resistance protein-like MFS transporter
MRKSSFLTLSSVVLPEVFGWGVVFALLPFLALNLGASPLIVGLVLAVYAACQSISSPIIGKLSDRLGRKPLLIFSQAASILSFVALAFANSLLLVFLSIIIYGLFGTSAIVVTAYITDISKGKKRVKYFTYNQGVRALGLAVGPLVGGVLAEFNYAAPFLVAALASTISLLITWLFVKRTIIVKKKIRIEIDDFSPLKDLVEGFRTKSLRRCLIEFFLLAMVASLITSNIGLFVNYQLGLGPLEAGFVLMILGSLAIFYQFFIQARLIASYKIKLLKTTGLLITFIATLLIFFVKSVFSLYLVALALGAGILLARPVVTNQLCLTVDKKEQGYASGLMGSLTSISGIIGPLIGGYIIRFFVPGLIGPVASIMAFIALLYGLRNGR